MPWWLQLIIAFTIIFVLLINVASFHRIMTGAKKRVLIDSEINLKVAIKIMPLSTALLDCIIAIESGEVITDERGKVYTQEFGEAFLNHLKEVVGLTEKGVS